MLWSTEYDIFGQLKNLKGQKDFIPFRQLGQYEDEELEGLYYNRFRYYDSEQGNYISKDPIGLKGGFQLYSFVHNSNYFFDLYGWEQGRGPDGKFLPKNPGDTAPESEAVDKRKV